MTVAVPEPLLPQARAVALIAQHDPRELSLFLGAGASASSGIPTASRMIAAWRAQAYREAHGADGSAEQVAAWAAAQPWAKDPDSEYSELFEALYPTERARQKHIERLVEKALPGWGYLYLANLIGAGYFNIVYTTNFDDLVSEALSSYLSLNGVVCAVDSQLDFISPTADRAKIIKLHGDYLFRRLKNTKDELRRLDPNMERKLREFSRHRGLVVLGYGGHDLSVMTTLAALLDDAEEYFPSGVLWGVHPERPIAKALQALLDAHPKRVRAFRCDSFESFMAALHQEVGLALPASVLTPYQSLRRRLAPLLATAAGGEAPIAAHRRMLEQQLAHPLAVAEGSPRLLLLEAQLAVIERDHASATAKAEHYLREAGEDAHGLSVLGSAAMVRSEETGEGEAKQEAVRHWQRALELDAGAQWPRRLLLQFHMAEDQVAEATAQAEALLEVAPRDMMVRVALAMLHLRAQRPEDALAQIDIVVAQHPEDGRAHGARADILYAGGRTEEALAAAATAVRLRPRHAPTRLGFGNLLAMSQRFTDAEAQMAEALRLEPDNPFVLRQLCFMYLSSLQPAKAVATLERLKRAAPAVGAAIEQQIRPALAEMPAQPPGAGPGRAGIPPPWQGLAGGLLELLKRSKR